MKKPVFILFLILCFSLTSNAQRYLTPIFSGTNSTPNIQYGANLDFKGNPENLILDFYEPQGDTLSKRPLIIYIHGGGFVDTNQNKSLLHIVAFTDSMARRGYAVASINYRLDTSISNRAVINAMHDAKAAVRFFKANANTYRLDTNYFFIGGESAGAITSLTATYIDQMSEVNYPPTPPSSSNLSIEGNSGNTGFSSSVKAVLCFCGGTQTVFNELLFDTLAMQQNDKPALFISGTADALIPIPFAVELGVRATNQNIPNLFYTLDNAGHCPWIFPLPNAQAYLDTLVDYTTSFLYPCLQPNSLESKLSKKNELLIYPNPTKGLVTIQITQTDLQNGLLLIRDFKGAILERRVVSPKNNKITANLNEYPPGLYLLEFQNTDWKFTGSVIIDN